jgi:hypothetical protein
MDLRGRIYIVPGFHEEWLHENPELADGNKSVAELILDKRWISCVLFAKGYVELCINDCRDREVVALLRRFLLRNASSWKNALVMPMIEEERFIQVVPEDLVNEDEFLVKFSCDSEGQAPS